MALGRAQIEQFRDEGFVAGIPIFSAAECERSRETAERFQTERPADRDWAFIQVGRLEPGARPDFPDRREVPA